MSIRCLQLLDLTSPPNKTRMKVGHPCTKKKKRNENFKCTAAPFPHDLLVKALNALCNELPVYYFLALCTLLKTIHCINPTGFSFASKLPPKNEELLSIEEA